MSRVFAAKFTAVGDYTNHQSEGGSIMFFPKFPTASDFTVTSLYKSLQDHLYIYKKFVGKKPEMIKKGEEFTIQFGIWNLMKRGVNFPNLWFKDVKLTVTGTRWAEPVKGFEEKINVNKDLGPFQQEFFEVKFIAKETFPQDFIERGLDFLEEIAFVRCVVDVDFKKLFHFEKDATFRESFRPEALPEDLNRFSTVEEGFIPHQN